MGMIGIDMIYNEDCLTGMQRIPDGSVDCIICDLPYGTMKGAQLDGWEGVKTDWDEIIPTDKLFEQYERVLRMNGVAILFSQEPYTNHLRGYQYKNTNFGFGYPLMWRKNHFANALIAKNAPVSYFEDISVFFKRFDTSGHHPLRDYFSAVMSYIGATSAKQINEKLEHRKAEHSFYVSPKQLIMQKIGGKADHTFRNGSTQFALCTAETYQEIIDKFHIDEMEGFKSYDELVRMDARFKRTFNLPEGQKYFGNVLEYAKDSGGIHPTQKPVKLMCCLVRTYTNEGDTVLDNCIGSGTTAIACIKEKRHFIGFEIDEGYFRKAQERIRAERQQLVLF